MCISFTKVALPYGWLGNMSPHPICYDGVRWRTAEALFQALRFNDPDVRQSIREQKSPMAAKMVAKLNKEKMVIKPTSNQDLDNMMLVLRLKTQQHPHLKKALLDTADEELIEDCGKRRASPWGCQKDINGAWVGENLLGKQWMKLREELRSTH